MERERNQSMALERSSTATDSMTGTSTTVASTAPDSGPYRVIAATANSKKLLAPISAPRAVTLIRGNMKNSDN